MGRTDERGDARTLQKRDMGTRPLLTSPEGNWVSVDIQGEALNVDGTVNWYKVGLVAKGYA